MFKRFLPRITSQRVAFRRLFSSTDLEAAKLAVQALPASAVTNQDKLKLYGFYKQATEGDNTTPKPGMLDIVGKYKWESWNSVSGMSKDEAAQGYVDYVKSLGGSLDGSASAESTPSEATAGGGDGVTTHVADGVLTITLDRAAKKNAITREMYRLITEALTAANTDDTVRVVKLTGAGEMYSSGNDLSAFTDGLASGQSLEELTFEGRDLLQKFVASFIDCTKPIVVVVNGPAVGIPVTTLALCDFVFAAHNATFHTPFAVLGQTPEACSSFTFPAIMGAAAAHEILLEGRKFTAAEAKACGLVTEVYERTELAERSAARIAGLAALPPMALQNGKALMRRWSKEQLHEVNAHECEVLRKQWLSDECMSAVAAFMSRGAR